MLDFDCEINCFIFQFVLFFIRKHKLEQIQINNFGMYNTNPVEFSSVAL